ncbi:MAG: hypothetical protein HQK59_18835 [Deltaproteobacteria bacterium]|nr:hypothetical protein [Deltaproteobacteria bacterium]
MVHYQRRVRWSYAAFFGLVRQAALGLQQYGIGREIYPTEMENVLYRLPQVAEAQVFGVPHPVRGMLLSAWIKPKPGNVITIEGTLNFLRSELGEEHIPDLIKVVTSFPATRSGKIQKFKMIEMTLAELQE